MSESTELQYETRFQFDADTIEPLESGLHEYNLAHLGEEVIYRYHRVAVLAYGPEGRVAGGIHGEMFWDWLYIHTMWVEDRLRGQGIGTQLLERIERAATEKGFYGSHVETTDFQALEFYRRNGYEIFGVLEGKPAGHNWYYLKKQLQPVPGLPEESSP